MDISQEFMIKAKFVGYIHEKITAWIFSFNNNPEISNEELLKQANKIIEEIHWKGFNIQNYLKFTNEDNTEIKIVSIDTCDNIMIEALNMFNNNQKSKKNKLSYTITYIFYYFQQYIQMELVPFVKSYNINDEKGIVEILIQNMTI